MFTATRTPIRIRKRLLAVAGVVSVVGAVLLSSVTVLAAKPTTSNPSVDLDQCRNGGLVTNGTQTFEPCVTTGSGNSGWVNGNAGASNAHYAEGESISYRARLSGLNVNDQVTLIMGYDVVHSGVHAIDFLTDKNRWQTPETSVATTPDVPCSGVTGCDGTSDLLTAPIPEPLINVQVDTTKNLNNGCEVAGSGPVQQPKTVFNSIPSTERVMEFFDATPVVSNAIQYVGPNPNILDKSGDQEQQISVSFTANSATPVLAWGGHIARAFDWGCADGPRSASGISGSPYHMRIKSIIVNGTTISLGNQDRSLSAAAVVVLPTTLPTTPNPSSGSAGATLNDSATVTGGTAPFGGTITFNLYGPGDTTCTGTVLYTQTVAVNSTTGSASTSPGYTTSSSSPGTYNWTASYSGDGINQASSSSCGSEAVLLKANPSAATNQNLIPNDSFTLSGGVSAGGTVDFYLFAPGNTCANTDTAKAAADFHQQKTLTSDAAATTNDGVVANGGYKATAEGTYKWLAVYSGDTNNNGAVSNCVEQFTIDNDNTN